MNKSMLVVGAALLAAELGGMTSPRAAACAASPCRPPSVFPSAGDVPGNFFDLMYSPPWDFRHPDAGLGEVSLYRVLDGTRVEVPVSFEPVGLNVRVKPRAELALGTQLVLVGANACTPTKPLNAAYTITESRSLPAGLGKLEVKLGRKYIPVAANASCAEGVDASYADITVRLTPELQPFAALLQYLTVLDGGPTAGWVPNQLPELPSSTERLPRGTGRVYALCQPRPRNVHEYDIALGVHRVKVIVTLPDGTKRETEEVELELRCEPEATGL